MPKNRCFLFLVLEKTLESPLDSKEIKPVNPKGNQPEYSLKGLMVKLQNFGHLKLKMEKPLMLGKRRGQQRMRWLDNSTNSKDMNLSKLQQIVKDRKAWRAAVHGVEKGRT